LEPRYGLDPEEVIGEVLKSMRLDTKNLKLSDEKKAELASRPPPEDPRVTAAKIMAKGREDAIVAGVQSKKMDLEAKSKENALDRAMEQRLAEIDVRLGMETLSSEERRDLEKQKVLLAKTTLELRTQTELSLGAHAIDLHKHRNPSPQVAPTGMEPVGRAAPGSAFQQ
jgi:hypothetical protein